MGSRRGMPATRRSETEEKPQGENAAISGIALTSSVMAISATEDRLLPAWRGHSPLKGRAPMVTWNADLDDSQAPTDSSAAKAALRQSKMQRTRVVRRLNSREGADAYQPDESEELNNTPKDLRYCDLLDANPDEFQSPKKAGHDSTMASFTLRLSEEGYPDWFLPPFFSWPMSTLRLLAAWRKTVASPFLLVVLVVLSLGVCVTSTLQPYYGGRPNSMQSFEQDTSPRMDGYVYTVSSMVLRGPSMRQFGAYEQQKFRSALAQAMGVASTDVKLLSAYSLGNTQDGKSSGVSSWMPRLRKDVQVQYEIAVPGSVDLTQHSLHLHRLTNLGILQRILRDLAGMSCQSLETKHTISRPKR